MTPDVGTTEVRPGEPWVRDVTADAIQHFVWGIGDNNPLWLEGSIAPPSFLYAVDETTVAPGHPGARRIYSSVEWTWYDSLPLAAAIQVAITLTDEGLSNNGNVRQEGRVDFSANDVLLATAVVECTRRLDASTNPDDRPEVRYSPEELEAIERTILSESRQGDRPLTAEEVSAGNVLGPLVKGPLSIMDVVAWCAGTQGVARDNSLSEGGLHAQCATGPQQIAWMIQLLTDWIGDGGFLHRLEAEIQSNPPLGSTSTITGEVVDVFKTETPGFIARVEARNQFGETSAAGHATVLMPSSEHGPVRLPVERAHT
ncbi:MAG: hypothetical protein ACR2PK_05860 [Acidimicrobiales bacterium]